MSFDHQRTVLMVRDCQEERYGLAHQPRTSLQDQVCDGFEGCYCNQTTFIKKEL